MTARQAAITAAHPWAIAGRGWSFRRIPVKDRRVPVSHSSARWIHQAAPVRLRSAPLDGPRVSVDHRRVPVERPRVPFCHRRMRPGLGNVRPRYSGTPFYAESSPNEQTNPEPHITMAKKPTRPNHMITPPPSDSLKYGARVYLHSGRLLIKQTVLRGIPPEYVIDEHRERFIAEDDDAAIASAIRDAVQGRL